jgi:hypothetical protein
MLKYTHSRILAFIGVSMVILFCFVPFLLVFCPTYYDWSPMTVTFSLIVLSVEVCFIFMSYFYAVFSEPGYFRREIGSILTQFEEKEIKEESDRTKIEITKNRKRIFEIKKSNTNPDSNAEEVTRIEKEINGLYMDQIQKATYCFLCNHVKPIRCHHCKVCNRCVLRMDHHCPWTGNCVGSHNMKFFIQFLFYASFALLTHFPFQAVFVLFADLEIDRFIKTVILFNSFSSVCVGLPIAYLLYYQIQNARVNITTVEDNIKGLADSKPFNKGIKGNVLEIIGQHYSFADIILPTRVNFESQSQLI